MIKLKTQPKSRSTELVKPKGTFPSTANQFKPGAEWRGNAGGRPRIIKEAYERRLMMPVEITENVIKQDGTLEQVKRIGTTVEAIAENLAQNAMTDFRFGVGAAQELRKVVEPTEEEASGSTDKLFIRTLAEVLLERKANAIEV